MPNSQVVSRVIDTVFSSVKIRSVQRNAVDASMTLGREGLGLDSVDILEIVVAIEHEFDVKVSDKETGESMFRSIGTIAQFVERHSPQFQAELATQ